MSTYEIPEIGGLTPQQYVAVGCVAAALALLSYWIRFHSVKEACIAPTRVRSGRKLRYLEFEPGVDPHGNVVYHWRDRDTHELVGISKPPPTSPLSPAPVSPIPGKSPEMSIYASARYEISPKSARGVFRVIDYHGNVIGQGFGLRYAGRNFVATCTHVADVNLFAQGPSGKSVSLKDFGTPITLGDMTMYEPSGAVYSLLALRPYKRVAGARRGQYVRVASVLDPASPTLANGVIEARATDRDAPFGFTHLVSTTPGDSGSPILTPDGAVIGIHAGARPDAQHNYAHALLPMLWGITRKAVESKDAYSEEESLFTLDDRDDFDEWYDTVRRRKPAHRRSRFAIADTYGAYVDGHVNFDGDWADRDADEDLDGLEDFARDVGYRGVYESRDFTRAEALTSPGVLQSQKPVRSSPQAERYRDIPTTSSSSAKSKAHKVAGPRPKQSRFPTKQPERSRKSKITLGPQDRRPASSDRPLSTPQPAPRPSDLPTPPSTTKSSQSGKSPKDLQRAAKNLSVESVFADFEKFLGTLPPDSLSLEHITRIQRPLSRMRTKLSKPL
jgi:hypothetical protein